MTDDESTQSEEIVNRSYLKGATPEEALQGIGVELARNRTRKKSKVDRGVEGQYNLMPLDLIGKYKGFIVNLLKPKWTLPTVTPYTESELEEREQRRQAIFRQRKLFAQFAEETAPATLEESRAQIEKLEIDADYTLSKKPVELEYANLVNRETARFFETFGDAGTVARIVFVDHLNLEVAQYNQDTLTISFQNLSLSRLQRIIDRQSRSGNWKSKTPGDIIWHELGHSYMTMLKTDVNFGAREYYANRLATAYEKRGV